MNLEYIFNVSNKLNSFLVIPNNIKSDVIKTKSNLEIKNKLIYKFKIISVSELIELLTYQVNNELYLNSLENNNLASSITKELTKFNRYNLLNKNDELNNFNSINQSFLLNNKAFTNNITDYFFNILGPIHLLKPFLIHFQINYKHFLNEQLNNINPLTFQSKEDELFYVFEKISLLLKDGIDINNIYLANYSNSDYTLLDKISKFYQIPVLINNVQPLINIPYINELFKLEYSRIISLLNNKEDLNNYFWDVVKINEEDFNNNINKVINIFNNYPYQKYKEEVVLKIIKNDLQNTSSFNNEEIVGVKIIDLDHIMVLDDYDYVFIINAAYEHFPIIAKDSDLLSDSDKELIGYPTSTEVNISINKYYEELINYKAVKHLSYALQDASNEYTASDIVTKYQTDRKITHINKESINFGFAINYYKYYFKDHNSDSLLSTFDPSFKIDLNEKSFITKYIENKSMKLSPTDITTYLHMPFVYYLEKIIGLSTFKESVSLNIGNYFHTIIEILYLVFFESKVNRSKDGGHNKFSNDEVINENLIELIFKYSDKTDDFDYVSFYNDFFDIYFMKELRLVSKVKTLEKSHENSLIIRTLFYIKKHQEEIIDALELLIDLEEHISSEELILEKTFELDNIKGKADLIKIYDNNRYSIIDYKTGSREAFNLEKINDLLEALLLGENNEISFGSLNLLQLVLYSYIIHKTYEEYKLNDLAYYSYFTNKLNGITTSSFNKEFYTDGKARIINSEEELNELYKKIELLIENSISKIKNADFNTNIRLDEKDKKGLDKSFYSVYEALIFFSEKGGFTNEDS